MFDERLPVHIDPLRMAETGRLLEGRYAIADLERLHDLLLESSGEVVVSLEFGIDAEGIRYMKGRLQGAVPLECQRCLQPMQAPIDSTFALGLVRSIEAAEKLPAHYEPLLLEGDTLFLRDVIEDELILALPLVAKHDESQCIEVKQRVAAAVKRNDYERGEDKKANPFAALAALKSNSNT
ncbi:MAG: YceD family protein [Gammaproteobacteria bacterium]|nr:YceD family protein [Gammaproteobacteria bacterium]